MKKVLVALATLAAAISIGFSVPAASQASATWCDGALSHGVYHNYAGYSQTMANEIPVGEGPSAGVNLKSLTFTNASVAVWVGAQAANGNWVQAGLVYQSGGLQQYIEWNDEATGGSEHQYFWTGSSFNTAYNVTITRQNSGSPTQWFLSVSDGTFAGSHALYTGAIPGHWYLKEFESENQNLPYFNSCNGFVARFTSTSVQRSNMYSVTDLPDWVDTLGTNSWNSNAPYLTR